MEKADRIFGVIGLGLSLWSSSNPEEFDYIDRVHPEPGFMPFWVRSSWQSYRATFSSTPSRANRATRTQRNSFPKSTPLSASAPSYLMLSSYGSP